MGLLIGFGVCQSLNPSALQYFLGNFAVFYPQLDNSESEILLSSVCTGRWAAKQGLSFEIQGVSGPSIASRLWLQTSRMSRACSACRSFRKLGGTLLWGP